MIVYLNKGAFFRRVWQRGLTHEELMERLDVTWPFAGFYENKLFNSNMSSNFVSIASLQGSKGNSVPPSEGLISLESLESGDSLTTEKPAKGQMLRQTGFRT